MKQMKKKMVTTIEHCYECKHCGISDIYNIVCKKTDKPIDNVEIIPENCPLEDEEE